MKHYKKDKMERGIKDTEKNRIESIHKNIKTI